MFSIISLKSDLKPKFTVFAAEVAIVSVIMALISGIFVYNLMGGPESFLPTMPVAGSIMACITFLFVCDAVHFAYVYRKSQSESLKNRLKNTLVLSSA